MKINSNLFKPYFFNLLTYIMFTPYEYILSFMIYVNFGKIIVGKAILKKYLGIIKKYLRSKKF